ncbi:methylmalonate-semialdehyde dehydrogenase [Aspergillus clavatus NRRL 1]|uniref:methylmalonate-semialdehyde dehydrogenase (CoA acylating) n=1 Tax=Aspergillus clavatus (strain ATCC 1007 / CBS 513.65 / DSM 816 / NCTC 3887 / NRRL 1 / QM 1276 / 107) TaxID=344612 RepID=A1C4H8_ASPCL|nr:methylmalonate-semialdehyde dehydrogenase [Aspergillus clavatus NRRL 1]EAW15318.1 methylmalonate-semialdehyde dehydrogenase [Aspergillus clavatus NRRL 1]
MAVTPFTFPFMIPLWSIPFALITGNTFVLKPSEKAPTASTLLATAFFRAGFPAGVLNIVHGGPSAVAKLLSQPCIQTVSFVGSETAAERIYDHARATRKRIQAECVGKNHGVVLDDADMMATLYAIAGSAFGAAGQRCMAMSVAVFVGSTREWIPKLVELAGSMVVGCPSDRSVKMGPLISVAAKDNVCGMIQRAVEERASLLLDGRDVEVPDYPAGNFVGPTILADVKTYMECYQTEILGPVLICMEVDTLEEAIDLINQNRCKPMPLNWRFMLTILVGNGCSLFTSSGQRATTFQRGVNVGQVGINVPLLGMYCSLVYASRKADHKKLPMAWQFERVTKILSLEVCTLSHN